MSDKPKSQRKKTTKQKSNGWKIYFTPDEVKYLQSQAEKFGYRSAQKYVEDKFRQERLEALKR